MATHNITINQGSTYQLMITLTDSGGTAINLTGYTFRGQIRDSTSSDTIRASFSFTIQTQSGATLGQVLAYIPAADTANIPVDDNDSPTRKLKRMIYDIESVDGSGTVTRWLEGSAYISPEVTR